MKITFFFEYLCPYCGRGFSEEYVAEGNVCCSAECYRKFKYENISVALKYEELVLEDLCPPQKIPRQEKCSVAFQHTETYQNASCRIIFINRTAGQIHHVIDDTIKGRARLARLRCLRDGVAIIGSRHLLAPWDKLSPLPLAEQIIQSAKRRLHSAG